eukprot:CAMPEP_0183400178 /NCGR_PEP_ID=MMETSP0370-20130417/12422_1 /TAXON_ID=268820 /ORGANISM="Peridinium aciculiferum, Strain PAER-2" /LENGTH=180 /DNA_ID=CAMNT_0025581439 /DNA_START=65 /DNA_END=607 /DNA_ORIENTATION=+
MEGVVAKVFEILTIARPHFKWLPVADKCFAAALSGTTEERSSVAAALMTVAAGAAHALQGVAAPSTCGQMNVQPWFMTCAGLWMLGSGCAFLWNEVVGLPFMAASMGGATATAALSPAKPGVFFSSATLGAVVYCNKDKLPLDNPMYILLVVGMWAYGIWGRAFLGNKKLRGDDSSAKKD